MAPKSLLHAINFAAHRFSLLLVDPKPTMVQWVNDFQKAQGTQAYRLCYPEANLVVIIPKDDDFSTEPGYFEKFLDRLKPRLLRLELARFKATVEDFGHPITSETFDKFYDLSLRESAMLMSDFIDAEALCAIGE